MITLGLVGEQEKWKLKNIMIRCKADFGGTRTWSGSITIEQSWVNRMEVVLCRVHSEATGLGSGWRDYHVTRKSHLIFQKQPFTCHQQDKIV